MLNKEQIVKLLQTSDKAVARALLVVNANQTADEQVQEDTKYRNGEGFRPCHARMGTSMATFYEKRGYLSPKQVAYWRAKDRSGTMRIALYWRQLAEAAERKAKAAELTTACNAYDTATAAGYDYGNDMEELMALEEQYADYEDSDDFPTLEKWSARITELRHRWGVK